MLLRKFICTAHFLIFMRASEFKCVADQWLYSKTGNQLIHAKHFHTWQWCRMRGVINWDTLLKFAYCIFPSLHCWKTVWRCAVQSRVVNSPTVPQSEVFTFVSVVRFTATLSSFSGLLLPGQWCCCCLSSPTGGKRERCPAVGQSSASCKLTPLAS